MIPATPPPEIPPPPGPDLPPSPPVELPGDTGEPIGIPPSPGRTPEQDPDIRPPRVAFTQLIGAGA